MITIAGIRDSAALTMRQRVAITLQLSAPAIMAQLSSIAMQFIDASMVGHLSADASASIGLVSTTTWLFWGLLTAGATGFSVQVAHLIGARHDDNARDVLRQAIAACLAVSIAIALVGLAISGPLPRWLGGNDDICHGASVYFAIFAAFLPVLQINFLAGSMLRCSGNMRVPSMLSVLMCVLDVMFNFLLIFPTRVVEAGPLSLTVPGAGLGITGAALGTGLAEAVTALLMMWFLLARSRELSLAGTQKIALPRRECVAKAARIGFPMALEHVVLCGAQIVTTMIVAPLGTVAIAANALAVTAESLCYMPGYGISDAATTLVGHSIGAGRLKLAKSFACICVVMGMGVMTVLGVVMYVAATPIMQLMTPFTGIIDAGAMCLRTEAWAEPMFAASIVVYGIFVGAGRTTLPCIINLASMWGVRITLAAILTPMLGLYGMWLAMCIELCLRGVLFLAALLRGRWLRARLIAPAK